MKKYLPVIAYFIVLIITLFLPASEGYDTVLWKLVVGQVFAIPVALIISVIIYFLNKKDRDSKK